MNFVEESVMIRLKLIGWVFDSFEAVKWRFEKYDFGFQARASRKKKITLKHLYQFNRADWNKFEKRTLLKKLRRLFWWFHIVLKQLFKQPNAALKQNNNQTRAIFINSFIAGERRLWNKNFVEESVTIQ